MFGYKAYLLIPLTVMAFVFIACGTAPAAAVAPQIIEVERIVEKAVPVETVREVSGKYLSRRSSRSRRL